MYLQPFLEGERVLLRPLESADEEALHAIARDPAVWEQHPIHDRWREEVFHTFFVRAMASGGGLAIIHRNSGAMIGMTRFVNYDPEDRATIEIADTFIEPRWWGRGINPQVKRLMLTHAFERVGRVEFRVGETNYRARIALEKIGASRTGASDLDRYHGKRVLDLFYAISADEFATGPLSPAEDL